MKTARILLMAVLCAPAPASAFHTAAIGVDALGQAALTMAGNPPLPMINYTKGTWKAGVMPAYFFGKPSTDDDTAGATTSGSFNGFGGGASYSYAFADRWGVYGWGVAARLKGDFNFTTNNNETSMSGVRGGIQFLSVGAAYQLTGGPGAGGIQSAVFFGPHLLRQSASQTVRFTNNGVLQDDFDMEIDDISPGLLLGAQAGFDLKEDFRFNPFLLVVATFGENCKTYSVTRQGADSGLSQQSTPDCGGNTGRKLQLTEDFNFAGGLNLIYKPWGLSVNLTAPILSRLVAGDAKMTMLTFTKSFGSFSR